MNNLKNPNRDHSYKKKDRSCPMCKPHKMNGAPAFKEKDHYEQDDKYYKNRSYKRKTHKIVCDWKNWLDPTKYEKTTLGKYTSIKNAEKALIAYQRNMSLHYYTNIRIEEIKKKKSNI